VRITINVRIDAEPSDNQQGAWGGGINFSEDATLQGAGFETVSKVFTNCHELIETLKSTHTPYGHKKP